MTIQILGAGMAGLLAAEMFRREQPTVLEAQASLPNNHGALLRFRSDAVAQQTGQPFAKVRVLKAIKRRGQPLSTTATLADNNAYAAKVSGRVLPRSILSLDPAERYIAPDTFLAHLASSATIQLGSPFTADHLRSLAGQREVATVSTIPMPVLMNIVGWPLPAGGFPSRPIWSVTMPMDPALVQVYQTIYYPEADVLYYRASITGHRLIVEYLQEPLDPGPDLQQVASDFGLTVPLMNHLQIKHQHYGKLLPIDDATRHEFIMAMTDQYNIYSVGRFATWRQILLDDVVHDLQVVARLIAHRSDYLRTLHGRGLVR